MLASRKGHEALRKGRVSGSGVDYFVTICTLNRRIGLHDPEVVHAVFDALRKIEAEGFWRLRTAVVMRDHLHLLFTLNGKANLAGVIRLFKGRLNPVIRQKMLQWQQAYFDRRLRTSDGELAVFLYIFLNSYRAGLSQRDERWLGYYCSEEDWAWFGALTDQSVPIPEWLA